MKILVYKRKVNFYETDAQGIVHHSNYPRYFEEARGYYLENIGYPYHLVRDELNIDIVLTELNVIYKKPLNFGDDFEIHFGISEINKYLFTFKYFVKKEDILCSEGVTKHCCIDRNTRKLKPVPKEILKGIQV